MRFAFVTLGSAGDLHPMLALAREMTDRGHDVALLAQAPHEQEVAREGVRFISIASQRDHDRTLTHPDLWHPIRGLGVLWRHLVVPAIEPTLDALSSWQAEQSVCPVVVAAPLAIGARLFRDQAKVPLISVATAPTALRTIEDPMFLGSWQVPVRTPRAIRSLLWRLLDWLKLDPLAQPSIRVWQQRLGIPPLPPQLLKNWLLSPDGVLALFPSEFCTPRPDWPPNTMQFGFPLYQPRVPTPLSPGLQRFLDAAPAPWLVYPGSAHAGATRETQRLQSLVSALIKLQQSVVLISRQSALSTVAEKHPMVHIEPWTDLSVLLPRAKAIVHHGGIGTCAWALAHHTPQVVWPSAYDQFENGWHVEAMRQGRVLHGQLPDGTGLLELIQPVISAPDGTPLNESTGNNSRAPETQSSSGKICDWLETISQNTIHTKEQ